MLCCVVTYLLCSFVFPLDNLGLLCDIEVTVNEDKKLAEDVDKEAYKSVLQQRGTHLIKLDEIPPNAQVTIKCTYISISNLVGKYTSTICLC